MNSYAYYDCDTEPIEVIISLTEDVIIDTIMLLSLENHSSFVKKFQVT